MISINVWLMAKKGEPRIYTATNPPAPSTVEVWRKCGYKIYRAEVTLPEDWDSGVDAVLQGVAVEAEPPR